MQSFEKREIDSEGNQEKFLFGVTCGHFITAGLLIFGGIIQCNTGGLADSPKGAVSTGMKCADLELTSDEPWRPAKHPSATLPTAPVPPPFLLPRFLRNLCHRLCQNLKFSAESVKLCVNRNLKSSAVPASNCMYQNLKSSAVSLPKNIHRSLCQCVYVIES